jgi:pimeloyl-ACP methyl ester carboxylesterase
MIGPMLLTVLLAADSAHVRRIVVAPAETVVVTEAGAGHPVVLLPGLFGAAYGFRKLAPGLHAAGFRTIVVEPLGIGWSSRPANADYTLTAQANRVAAVLDSLRVRQALIVAHAVGASIALRLAYRRPDLVAGVIALEGGTAEAAATPGFRRSMAMAPWLRIFGGVGRLRREVRHSLIVASADTTWVTDEAVAGYTAGAATDLSATLRAFQRMARAREPELLAPHLPLIQCPVRLLFGGGPHQHTFNELDVAVLRGGLRIFAVDTVAGAGLYMHEERPEAIVRSVAKLAQQIASERKSR